MQFRDVSPRWPLLLGLLAGNYLLAWLSVIAFWTDWPLYYSNNCILFGIWAAQTVPLALTALLMVRQRSVQLALVGLLPLVQGYVVVLGERTFGYTSREAMILPVLVRIGILSVCCAAFFSGLHWLLGWKLALVSAEEKPPVAIRFRLADLIVWTLAVAIPLTFLRLFDVEGDDFPFDIAALVFLLGLPSVFLLCSSWQVGRGLIVVVLMHALGMFPYAYNLFTEILIPASLPAWRPPWWIDFSYGGLMLTSFLAVTLANLLTLRFAGYRWQRE